MRKWAAIAVGSLVLAVAVPAVAHLAHKHVVFGGDVAGSFRARPTSIHLTSDENIQPIQWSAWGGKTTQGSGTAVFSKSDGIPPAPVDLSLSRRSHCGKRIQYLKLHIHYVSGGPPGSSSFTVRYTCSSPF